MRLRRGSYITYNGKETLLYRDGVINKLVIPLYDDDFIDDKCIQDEWGGYTR